MTIEDKTELIEELERLCNELNPNLSNEECRIEAILSNAIKKIKNNS